MAQVHACNPYLKPAAPPENGDQPEQPTPKAPGALAPGKVGKGTATLAEANVVAFVPRRLEVSSLLLMVAKEVTEREWGWPEMQVGDWLDTYLYWTLRQRGIVVGAYQVIGGNHGS